jgi:hypothetical protein
MKLLPPSMAWPGPSLSSHRHAPKGAHPLPRPPVGGRGGLSKGKGRDLGPPPPINCATRPPPKGSYAQTACLDGGVPRSSVDGIVRLAKAFPELPTKRLKVMQRAAGLPHKVPRASATVHGPSRRQVLVTIHPAQGTPTPNIFSGQFGPSSPSTTHRWWWSRQLSLVMDIPLPRLLS